jgi:hypothetical protein
MTAIDVTGLRKAYRGHEAVRGIDLAADLTVREMVRHVAGLYPDPRPAGEVIELVGLTEKRNSRIRTLSGGQRRRVDVALGIVGRPELLFFDEPTTGFDPQARRQFWDLIRALAALATAFVTMGSGLALDREDGTLKRLHGTPAPAAAYLLGKLILVLVGSLVFGMTLPDAGHWLTFAWLFVLSVVACSLLSIAVSAIVKRGRTAGAILNVPVIALQFISGVSISYASSTSWR